jgi:hypothetical protein
VWGVGLGSYEPQATRGAFDGEKRRAFAHMCGETSVGARKLD